MGRRILSELSQTIILPDDNNGIEFFNTIENLLEFKAEISTLDIIKALPSNEISLDIDNLILIISSWKKELAMQQNLIAELGTLEKTSNKVFKNIEKQVSSEPTKIIKKIYSLHRDEPLEVELWKSNKNLSDKELIIFMPGLGGDINNFKWIASQLNQMGWPILFLDQKK